MKSVLELLLNILNKLRDIGMKKFIKISAIFIILLTFVPFSKAQSIFLNDGFEGTPTLGTPPPNWRNCNDGNSSGDTQPGFFNNFKEASEGNSYLSLVTRGVGTPGTVETVWARLIKPFEKNKCYNFSVDLSLSNDFMGAHSFTEYPFNKPCVFQIIGYTGICNNQVTSELLWESPILTNFDWETFDVKVIPQIATFEYIAIRPFFTPSDNFENSAVFVDNLQFKVTPDLIILENGEITLPEGAVEIDWYFNGEYVKGEHALNIPFQGNGTYKAIFYDANGCFTITTKEINFNIEHIKIYPNPTNSKINIDNYSLTNDVCKFYIYDELGKLFLEYEYMQEKGLNKTKLDLSFLAPAVYYLKIKKTDLRNDMHKIVVGQ